MGYRISSGTPLALTLNEGETVASIIQNISVLLNTYKGEVPMDREKGISHEILHRPVKVAKTLLVSEVAELIEKYEPRVTVTGVTVEENTEEPGALTTTVEVEINE